MQTSRFLQTLLSLTLLGGGVAAAQSASTYDPAQLPAFHGRVAQYDLSSRGGVDGIILDDGTEVHTPRHLDDELVAAVKPGDAVTIHGLKARELKLIQAMSITNDASAATVADTDDDDEHGHRHDGRGRGRDDGDDQSTQAVLHGLIGLQLHDTAGNLDGVVLEDHTVVHLATADAEKSAAALAPGQMLFVRGDAQAGATGKMIRADAIGPSADRMTVFATPRHGRHYR